MVQNPGGCFYSLELYVLYLHYLLRTFFCHLFLGCLAHHHCGVLVSCLNSAKE